MFGLLMGEMPFLFFFVVWTVWTTIIRLTLCGSSVNRRTFTVGTNVIKREKYCSGSAVSAWSCQNYSSQLLS